MGFYYANCAPDQYLAVTGRGIKNVKITKSCMIWPFQKYTRISIQPRNYDIPLSAMTKEKLQLIIPVQFTIGPRVMERLDNISEVDAMSSLLKYAQLLADKNENTAAGKFNKKEIDHVDQIIRGIIEGMTRVAVSNLTIEEIFSDRTTFKLHIQETIQQELDNFGLHIYNANVRELADAPGSHYLSSLSRKAHEGATNQAKVDVAEAQSRGNVKEREHRSRQEREIAKIEAETAVQRTLRDTEKAEAEARLTTSKTEFSRDVSIAQITAERHKDLKDAELSKQVQIKLAESELERLRATDVVQASIAREAKQEAAQAKAFEVKATADANTYSDQKKADAAAYSTERGTSAKAKQTQAEADANLYQIQKEADAVAYRVRVEAEAKYIAATKEAEAIQFRQKKEAEGLAAMAHAYSDLSLALGGPEGLIKYMMIEKGTYRDLALANAEAVRGMAPKMTIWNTGSDAGGEDGGNDSQARSATAAIRNTYQMLPPLMETIHEQTGITLPEWQFGKLGQQAKEMGPKLLQGDSAHDRNSSIVTLNGSK